MSDTGTKLPLAIATVLASNVCASIIGESHVVGSVRRRKPEVGDIEVMVRQGAAVKLNVSPGGLYGGEWETIKGGGEKWKFWQLRHSKRGYVLDLYRFDENNRGSIMLIRTGPAEFSRRFVMELRERGLRHEDGYVRSSAEPVGDAIVPCPLEKDAFALAGMEWVEPEDRG